MANTSEKKTLPLGIVTEILALSKLQVRNIFTHILREECPDTEHEIHVRAQWFLFVADLLQRVKFLTSEQQMLVLGKIDADYTDSSPVDLMPHLVFADGQYCTWDGHTGWLQLETGENTDELPQHPLETIGYNLFELRRRCAQKIENRTGKNAEHHARSMDEPRNVRNSAFDSLS
jgi:hypothetical protein